MFQGFVRGPLLFNINTTWFACYDDIDSVVTRVELDSAYAVKWFSDNYMRLDEDKCHLITFGDISKESLSVEIGSSTISYGVEDKIFGVVLDSKLTFKQHISNLSQKRQQRTLCSITYISLYEPK